MSRIVKYKRKKYHCDFDGGYENNHVVVTSAYYYNNDVKVYAETSELELLAKKLETLIQVNG